MTREETKKRFQSWCQGYIGNNASDEDYQMFNNIMALLEQEPILDRIRAEIENTEIKGYIRDVECYNAGINFALHIIAKYKADSLYGLEDSILLKVADKTIEKPFSEEEQAEDEVEIPIDKFKELIDSGKPVTGEDLVGISKEPEEVPSEEVSSRVKINITSPTMNKYTMSLQNKAGEIKTLIDENEANIRYPDKDPNITIEVWSDVGDRGNDYGVIRIVNGGEALKLKYNENDCTGCDYCAKIFHHGDWRNVVDVYREDTMKTVLKDVFETSIDRSDRFNPNLNPHEEGIGHKTGKTTPTRQ